MKNLDIKAREIVILADWDGSPDHPAWKNTLATQKALQEQENAVSIALPVPNPGQNTDKVDFNDVLLKNGPEEIRNLVEKAAQTIVIENSLEKIGPNDAPLKQENLSYEEKSFRTIETLLTTLDKTPDEDAKEKIMEKLDDKIKTLEQLGCFDKPSARYKDIREIYQRLQRNKGRKPKHGIFEVILYIESSLKSRFFLFCLFPDY